MRIRSVKPEFWRDSVTGEWPADLSLFFIGLWCVADDGGCFEWDPRLIRADVDPFDVKFGGLEKIEELLARLESSGRVRAYLVSGREYGIIPSFARHQHPQKPSSRCPIPLPDQYYTRTIPVSYRSITSPQLVRSGGEGIGGEVERNGRGSKSSEHRTSILPAVEHNLLDEPAAPPAPAEGDGGRATPPPPKPKRNGTDPRFAPLRAAFEAEFLAATGQPYRWQGPKDAKALHTLIAVPVEDFRAKAQAGLRANGFPRSPTVSQLAAKWNDLTIATGPPAQTRKQLSNCKPWDDLLEHARSNGGRETAKWLMEYVSPRVEDKTLVLEAPDQCRAEYIKRHLAGIESAALEQFGLAVRLVVGKTCHH